MVRQLRIQYPGAVYHVMCRGNEQKIIYQDDDDRKKFLKILFQSANIYSVKLHSYVLMDNHFHLLVETPLANLSEFMRHLNITYTSIFNRRHRRVGHLYQGRYKSILVEKEAYLSILSRYIHLNPIRVMNLENLNSNEKLEQLLNYNWSSLPGYLDERWRDGLINYTLVLADYGGDVDKGRSAYRNQIIADIDENLDVKSEVFSQSILGGGDFINWVKETYLGDCKTREQPAAGEIKRYKQKEAILELIEIETGKNLESLKQEKGDLRRVAMDLLYRHGGVKGPEIGALFCVDYSAVSQERKRLRERVVKDEKLEMLMKRLEGILSMIKI